MRVKRLTLLASAIAFARSEQGQRLIADARRRYDTPENRAKVNEAIAKFRNRPPGEAARRAP